METNLFDPERFYSLANVHPPTSGMAIGGAYLYVPRYDRLWIYDLSAPDHPLRVENLPISAFDMAFEGNVGYLAKGAGGIWVMDLTDPIDPKVVDSISTQSSAIRLTKFGNRMAATGYRLDDLKVCGSMEPRYCYRTGITFLDASNPLSPVKTDSFFLARVVHKFSVMGAYGCLPAQDSGIQLFDLSKPDAARKVGNPIHPNWNLPEFSGDHLIMPTAVDGFQLVSFQDPANPVYRGRFTTLGRPMGQILAYANYARISHTRPGYASDATVSILDLADKDTPKLVEVRPGGSWRGFAQAGNRACVIEASGSLWVSSFAGQKGLEPLDLGFSPMELDTAKYVDVEMSGAEAYLLDSRDLRIVDLSKPDSAIQLGSYSFNSASEIVAVIPPRAYVLEASGEYGKLHVLDISDPANPVKAGDYAPSSGGIFGAAMSGARAFVVRPGKITVVDLTNPALPKEVDSLSGPSARAIKINGESAYVTCGSEGILIIPATGPLSIAKRPGRRPFKSRDSRTMVGAWDAMGRHDDGKGYFRRLFQR